MIKSILLLLNIFIFFINISFSVSVEYNIKNVVPSHLYRKFDNVKEDIFPHDIRIKISLRRIKGTLLYSIDRHMNQFILTLDDIPEPNLGIEFRKKNFYVFLSSLCGCLNCYYEVLDLIIQLKESIYVSCNGQTPKTFSYDNVKLINEAYPVFYSHTDNAIVNEGQLWLVNTPYYKGKYPNGDQLKGCIFNVWYNNEVVNFTEIIKNVELQCPITCIKDICNGGDCIETYNSEPLCNCTSTFLNGVYCNDTLHVQNLKFVENNFNFAVFKLSWNSSSKNIFSLDNSVLQFGLSYSGSVLSFTYNYAMENKFLIKRILTQKYEPNKKYICIVYFNETFFTIKFFNNLIWRHFTHFSYVNLRKQTFSSLSLRSGNGTIGFFYKIKPKTVQWKNTKLINIIEAEEKDVPEIMKSLKHTPESTQSYNSLELAGIILSVLFGLITIITIPIITFRFKKLINENNDKDAAEDDKDVAAH